uniref:Uncharacterized protein n=1 Tax=Onchocerca volvulus TaxID=6282 RepID=A0A8R1TW96_ONCVO
MKFHSSGKVILIFQQVMKEKQFGTYSFFFFSPRKVHSAMSDCYCKSSTHIIVFASILVHIFEKSLDIVFCKNQKILTQCYPSKNILFPTIFLQQIFVFNDGRVLR